MNDRLLAKHNHAFSQVLVQRNLGLDDEYRLAKRKLKRDKNPVTPLSLDYSLSSEMYVYILISF